MKKYFFIFLCISLFSCQNSFRFNNGIISYEPLKPTETEIELIRENIQDLQNRFDVQECMIIKKINTWDYHTDALTGDFHEIRASFNFAGLLLDSGDEQLAEQAFGILEKTISLQDQDSTSISCGVWPYYMEEPLATKKSPIDFNWADFSAVSLLDVWMGHQTRIPGDLKPKIQNALILAAKSIQKRNMGPDYTNIAIMGTYVTYMVSNLFDLEEMKQYATIRLNRFYEYTLNKGGFTEYNSPTYTIVALDELLRMKTHVIEPSAKQQIDSLYSIGWEMIARHYHQPSGQWAGPHSRSYSTLVKPSFYTFLSEGSDDKIDVGVGGKAGYVKLKHQIPDHLMHYFLAPEYPRTETDLFEKVEPQVVGTSYLTTDYAFSSINRSSFWNQRRPFLVYWGTPSSPKYIQLRFLHDGYDFSSVSVFCSQEKNKVLAGINFVTNGGDKHINLDVLPDGSFKARDLRLRFEIGGNSTFQLPTVPKSALSSFSFEADDQQFSLSMLFAEFDQLKGHWETSGDKNSKWLDFVLYSGEEKLFNLVEINKAALCFAFAVDQKVNPVSLVGTKVSAANGHLDASWDNLTVSIPLKPAKIERLPANYPNNL